MRAFSICIIAMLGANANSNAAAETIRVVGSTTFTSEIMEPYRAKIEELSGHKVLLLPTRTAQGVLALFEGSHVAMISTAMGNVVEELKRTNPGLAYDQLREFSISRTRSALAVHLDNPIRYISLSTLKLLLTGSIHNWQQLGWRNRPIEVVMVRPGGGIQLSMETQLGIKVAAKQMIRVQISSQVNKVVEQEPEAVGLAQIENLKHRHVAELKTDIQFPQELNLVTLGPPSPATEPLIHAVRKIVAEER